MVDTPEQAERMARAMRYPPQGIRGIGSALARAARWNQVDDYLNRANDEMCLLVQAESRRAVDNLQAIAELDGVDGVFFGPADLAADMGHRGQLAHPDVQQVIVQGIATVRAAGKAAGVLSTEPAQARGYIAAGAQFVAVGVDTVLLVKAARDLSAFYRRDGHGAAPMGAV
jgi:4-hydroxy-2-oxoheptanedioate aldolase